MLIKVAIDKSELPSPRPGAERDGESRLRPPLVGLRVPARRDRIHSIENFVSIFLITLPFPPGGKGASRRCFQIPSHLSR